jgi:tetratricopeptide (TPR) repeat protein
MRQGAQFAWDSRWREAIDLLEVARTEFPDDPIPYSRIGQAYFELSEFEQALRYYQQAARLNPNDIVALGRIADVLERLGRLDEAARTYMAVAEAYLRIREADRAISHWERAIRLDPGLLGAHQRLALIYRQRGRLRDSVREHLAIARIYQRRGEIRQAALACKAALEMDPANTDVLAAVALLRQGSTIETEPRLPPAVESAPGEVALDWDDGVDSETGVGGSPVEEARQTALADLAGIVFEEEAAGVITPLAKADRDALISRAIELQTRGEIDGAISTYEEAIKGGVDQPAAHFNLGLLYQERLHLDEAISQFAIAVRDSEYELGSHFALGECYRAKGKVDDALAHFLEVAKIVDMRTVSREQADDLVRLYENLADTYLVKGEHQAVDAFTTALVEFLGTRGWEDKVREARERLNAIAEDGQTIGLGEILAQPGSEQLLESISLTNEYARRGWLDSALEEGYRAVQLAPFYLPAHLLLARLLERRGRIEAAGSKYVTVADTFRARGDARRAMDSFEKAMTLAPLDMGLRTRLVDMLKRHGEIDRALEHSVALAEAHYQLAQIEKAREKYLEALELAPRGSPERQWKLQILHRIADVDMQRLAWRDAVTAYHQIVRIAPDDERASVTLAELLFKLGQGPQALGEVDRYLGRLASQGRTKKILAILNSMAAQQPDNMGLLNRLAAAYAQAGDRDKAIEHLDRLGELQLDAGMRAEAAVTIQSILSLRPADARSYQQLLAQLQGKS